MLSSFKLLAVCLLASLAVARPDANVYTRSGRHSAVARQNKLAADLHVGIVMPHDKGPIVKRVNVEDASMSPDGGDPVPFSTSGAVKRAVDVEAAAMAPSGGDPVPFSASGLNRRAVDVEAAAMAPSGGDPVPFSSSGLNKRAVDVEAAAMAPSGGDPVPFSASGLSKRSDEEATAHLVTMINRNGKITEDMVAHL